MSLQRSWLPSAVALWASLACVPVGARPRPEWGHEERDAERRCQAGATEACASLGETLVAEGRTEKEHQRGLVLLEATCGRQEIEACAALGVYYAAGRGVSTRARGRDLLAWACERRSARACTGLRQLGGHREPTPVEPREDPAPLPTRRGAGDRGI